MNHKVEKLRAGDVIYPSKIGLILPFGVASAFIMILEMSVVFVFLLGMLKSPESVIESFSEGNPLLYTILAGYLIFLFWDIGSRILLSKSRLIIGVDSIQRKTAFSITEIPITLVENIKRFDRAFYSDLVLQYQPLSKVREKKFSGWLFSKNDLKRISIYIGGKNIRL